MQYLAVICRGGKLLNFTKCERVICVEFSRKQTPVINWQRVKIFLENPGVYVCTLDQKQTVFAPLSTHTHA